MIHPAYLFIGLLALSACFFEFDQQRFTQERCVGDTTKFACTTDLVGTSTAGSISLLLENRVGESVSITGLTTSEDCGIEEPSFTIMRDGADVSGQVLEHGDVFILAVQCEVYPQDSVFDETFVIHYDIADGVSGLRASVEAVVLT